MTATPFHKSFILLFVFINVLSFSAFAQKFTDTGISQSGDLHYFYVNEQGEVTCTENKEIIEKVSRQPSFKLSQAKEIHVHPESTHPLIPMVRTRVAPTATISVTYNGFSDSARTAFQAAVDIWQTLLSSSQTIRINANFSSLGTNILGSAGPTTIRLLTTANTWYPVALAESILNSDVNSGAADINATFSSNFSNFYFGTDGNVPAGKIDFLTVVLHEIGHGVGFLGSVRSVVSIDPPVTINAPCVNTVGSSCWGFTAGGVTYPTSFDRSVKNGSNVSDADIITFANPSSTILDFLQSGNVFFHGANVKLANGNAAAKLHAPSTYAQGSSYSHFDETLYATGTPSSLMTPSLATREVHRSPGQLGCALLKDIGWTVAGACSIVLPVELSELTASKEGYRNHITWTTLSERNNKSFIVERSKDGVEFKEIGVVEGFGTTQMPRNYSFYDQTPLSISYYRLKQIDFDDNASSSKIVSVINEERRDLVLFPNPAQDKIFIAAQNDSPTFDISIYDNLGRNILSKRISNEIDISDLNSGIYEIVLITEGVKTLKRFVKQ